YYERLRLAVLPTIERTRERTLKLRFAEDVLCNYFSDIDDNNIDSRRLLGEESDFSSEQSDFHKANIICRPGETKKNCQSSKPITNSAKRRSCFVFSVRLPKR